MHKNREPEEPKMMPGTERAIITLAETMIPRLTKTLDRLTAALEKTGGKLLQGPEREDGKQVAALALTKAQWSDLLEALEDRIARIGKRDFGNAPNNTDGGRWLDDLNKLHKTVLDALAEQDIVP